MNLDTLCLNRHMCGMSNATPRLITRTTTRRKVVLYVETIREIYETPAPQRPVIETTGVEIRDSQLPAPPASARKAAPVISLFAAAGARSAR